MPIILVQFHVEFISRSRNKQYNLAFPVACGVKPHLVLNAFVLLYLLSSAPHPVTTSHPWIQIQLLLSVFFSQFASCLATGGAWMGLV